MFTNSASQNNKDEIDSDGAYLDKLANKAGSNSKFSCSSGMGSRWDLFGLIIIRNDNE